ncbi:YozE family protein [Sphingomonas sp. Leaf4]|uniref:YozE family protein n=1 Tax=Sphingomonas sp. Leaf4 TaxID=2876553 RepID=UPI001E589149|nr:YozE family protein [Sphingomonas sp. Leaf4]
MQTDRYGEPRPSFAAWLLLQRDRGDWVDQVAEQARRDRSFPRVGSADEVRAYLGKAQVEGDVHAMIDDAELDYYAY